MVRRRRYPLPAQLVCSWGDLTGDDTRLMTGQISPDGVVFVRTLIDGVEQLVTLDARGNWLIQQPGDGYDRVLALTPDGHRAYEGRVLQGNPKWN